MGVRKKTKVGRKRGWMMTPRNFQNLLRTFIEKGEKKREERAKKRRENMKEPNAPKVQRKRLKGTGIREGVQRRLPRMPPTLS
jgi:hypothetical protein